MYEEIAVGVPLIAWGIFLLFLGISTYLAARTLWVRKLKEFQEKITGLVGGEKIYIMSFQGDLIQVIDEWGKERWLGMADDMNEVRTWPKQF